MDILPLILILVILLIVIGVAALVMSNQEKERKARMMTVIQGSGGHVANRSLSKDEEQNKRREELTKKLQESKKEEASEKKKTPISLMIGQAGLDISSTQFWIFSAVFAVVAVLFAKMMGQSLLITGLTGVTAFFGIPRFVLKRMAAKRQKKFLEDFADGLEAMVRLLKAGMPVSEAVAMIAKEYTGPLGEEMAHIYDQQKIGVPLHEAALAIAQKRMPLPEMHMFATGLAIQAQTGSSLSDVLGNLAGVIRARFKLKRKIKALSSEAIASASIIGVLPILLALGLYFANREYIMLLFTDSFGQILLGGAVFWMGCGVVMMKIMINFKV